MEGIFKGWLPGKNFGFVVPADQSRDIFIHMSSAPEDLAAGSRITFEVDETDKGRVATNVSVVQSGPRVRGRVKFWSDRGFGFLEPADGSGDVYIHGTALPAECTGHLTEGEIVEFSTIPGAKGPEARNITPVSWSRPSDYLASFADMGPGTWLEELAELAEPEPWNYTSSPQSEPLPILKSYVRYTFRRLSEMDGGIAISMDGKCATFNTGLVTPNQEEIYAMFRQNPRTNRQPWCLLGFKKASDWAFIDNFGASPPPLANYFDDPSVLLYDRRCELYINIDHVMEHLPRFPKHLQSNPYVARQLMISAEATTKKRVYRNYKTAVPQYYREKGGEGGVQLLLPICLESPSRADLALVVAKNEAGDAYRGSTVLTLDMAYNNARLLARPDTEWLQP